MSAGIEVRLFEAGFCVHPACMVKPGAGLKPMKFPAGAALIKHPERGYVLFDTGYHARFSECTAHFPEKLYALTTPHTLSPGHSLIEQFDAQGITRADIKTVVLSHFHADHVAGICDFAHADIYCHIKGYQFMQKNSRWGRLRKGYLKDLLPAHIEQSLRYLDAFPLSLSDVLGINDKNLTLQARDIFDDNTLFAVSLPGHAAGHIGLLVRLSSGFIFLLADACWLKESLTKSIDQHWLANILCDDVGEYKRTLNQLRLCYQRASDYVHFVPSHCETTVSDLIKCGWIH